MNSLTVSPEFPLPISKYCIVNKPINKPKHHITKSLQSFYFNSEAPDAFRLDNLKENKYSYKNPFYNEILPVDRNEAFKKMDFNAKQVKLIDFIKSNRELSQDPKILKYIRTDFDVEMAKKREKLKHDNENKNNNSLKNAISYDNLKDRKIFEKGLSILKTDIPKISFKYKNQIDNNNLEPILNNKYKISKFDKENFKTFSSNIEVKKSGCFGNINDYDIKEGDTLNDNLMCHIKRKSNSTYNVLTHRNEIINYPNIINNKWNKYQENFFILMNKGGFRKKGGIFNELNNKIISVIKPKKSFEGLNKSNNNNNNNNKSSHKNNNKTNNNIKKNHSRNLIIKTSKTIY